MKGKVSSIGYKLNSEESQNVNIVYIIKKHVLKAEEIFHACTANGLRKIEINCMVEELLQDVELVSIFNGIIESSGNSNDIDVDVKNNIILTMLKLYLCVRTFSLSRDVIARHRQELKVKKANKGIRKTLKAYTDKSKCDA